MRLNKASKASYSKPHHTYMIRSLTITNREILTVHTATQISLDSLESVWTQHTLARWSPSSNSILHSNQHPRFLRIRCTESWRGIIDDSSMAKDSHSNAPLVMSEWNKGMNRKMTFGEKRPLFVITNDAYSLCDIGMYCRANRW